MFYKKVLRARPLRKFDVEKRAKKWASVAIGRKASKLKAKNSRFPVFLGPFFWHLILSKESHTVRNYRFYDRFCSFGIFWINFYLIRRHGRDFRFFIVFYKHLKFPTAWGGVRLFHFLHKNLHEKWIKLGVKKQRFEGLKFLRFESFFIKREPHSAESGH